MTDRKEYEYRFDPGHCVRGIFLYRELRKMERKGILYFKPDAQMVKSRKKSRKRNRCLSKRQIHNHISHFDVLVPKDRKHLIQVLRIFHVQKDYTQLVAGFPHNLCE